MAKYKLKENISFDGEIITAGSIVDTDSIAISGDSLTLWGWADLVDESVADESVVERSVADESVAEQSVAAVEEPSESDPVEPPKRRKK
jgi:hypothetical protein